MYLVKTERNGRTLYIGVGRYWVDRLKCVDPFQCYDSLIKAKTKAKILGGTVVRLYKEHFE